MTDNIREYDLDQYITKIDTTSDPHKKDRYVPQHYAVRAQKRTPTSFLVIAVGLIAIAVVLFLIFYYTQPTWKYVHWDKNKVDLANLPEASATPNEVVMIPSDEQILALIVQETVPNTSMDCKRAVISAFCNLADQENLSLYEAHEKYRDMFGYGILRYTEIDDNSLKSVQDVADYGRTLPPYVTTVFFTDNIPEEYEEFSKIDKAHFCFSKTYTGEIYG